MSTQASGAALPYFHAHDGRRGILAWILSTDHKRIGILYFVSVIFFFLTGVVLGMLMRLELIGPGRNILDPAAYNAMFTVHGIIMVFLVVIPAVPTIFGNFCLPILIGARDMSFPRLNLASWYLYVAGAIIVFASLLTAGGPVDTGWTFSVSYTHLTLPTIYSV